MMDAVRDELRYYVFEVIPEIGCYIILVIYAIWYQNWLKQMFPIVKETFQSKEYLLALSIVLFLLIMSIPVVIGIRGILDPDF